MVQIINSRKGDEVAAIIVRGMGKDENGLQQYIWATKKQLARLLEAQYDEVERNFVFKVGDYGIRPCDILSFKIVEVDVARNWPAFRGYVLGALEKEKKKLAEGTRPKGWID